MGFWVDNAREWQRNNKYNNKTMAITAKKTNTRELVEPGVYMARCCKIVHIGTRSYERNDTEYEINEAALYFDIVQAERPTMIEHIVNLNTNKDSDFRKLLLSWRGADLTEEEEENYDIVELLCKPAMVNITHKQIPIKATGGTFTKEEISAIMPMPRDMKCPEGKIAPAILDYDNWDKELFDGLSKFIKGKMVESKEYKGKFGPLADTSDRPNGGTK